MSSKLPVISGVDLSRILNKVGFQVIPSRGKGSHIFMKNDSNIAVTIPNHKELKRGTLKAILRHVGLSSEEFLKLL